MAIQFWNGQILFVGGRIAMDPACCCGTHGGGSYGGSVPAPSAVSIQLSGLHTGDLVLSQQADGYGTSADASVAVSLAKEGDQFVLRTDGPNGSASSLPGNVPTDASGYVILPATVPLYDAAGKPSGTATME